MKLKGYLVRCSDREYCLGSIPLGTEYCKDTPGSGNKKEEKTEKNI